VLQTHQQPSKLSNQTNVQHKKTRVSEDYLQIPWEGLYATQVLVAEAYLRNNHHGSCKHHHHQQLLPSRVITTPQERHLGWFLRWNDTWDDFWKQIVQLLLPTRITGTSNACKLIFQNRVSFRKCLNTLMYTEAISTHIICWEKRIINVYRINTITPLPIPIDTTSLHWYTHLARIKHITAKQASPHYQLSSYDPLVRDTSHCKLSVTILTDPKK
jgi:hypothetical protein